MILCFEYDSFSTRIAFDFSSVMCSIVLLWLVVLFFSFNSPTNWITCTVMPVCKSEPNAFSVFCSLVCVLCVLSAHFIYHDVAFMLTHHLYAFVTICTVIQFTFTVTTVSDVCKTVGCMHVDNSREAQKENSIWATWNLRARWMATITTIAMTQTREKKLPSQLAK